ncbi:MAG: O-methyltransferase [Phycisphaerae bacterium]|nr:O-methyltransferase [Phycisphaerae bacterium]
MLKKIILGISVAVLLAGVLILTIQEQATAAAAREGRTAGSRDQGPQGGPGTMRGGLEPWLDEVTKAYEQNDREKMGQLIEDMKQRSQRFQRGMDRPDRGGPPEGMGRGPMGGMAGMSSSEESAPLAKTEVEKKILSVLDDMDRSDRRGMMNVPITDGRLLRLLTESIGAKHVVEIGTSNGYSGTWLCLALSKTGGKLTTFEIDERRASLARENFKRAGVEKLVTLIEGDAHKEAPKLKEPIDLLFIDADKEGYADYLKKLLPLVRPGGLILAHNINMRGGRSGIPDYVKAVTTNPDLETIFYVQGGGVSVTLKKR